MLAPMLPQTNAGLKCHSDDLKVWSKMEPIRIEGLSKDDPHTNVYFMKPVDWNSTHTAAFFPGVTSQGHGMVDVYYGHAELVHATVGQRVATCVMDKNG